MRQNNVIHYRQNRYAMPKGTYFPGRKARIEADEENETVEFCDSNSGELERALAYCTERELFSTNDFRYTLEYFRREEPCATHGEEIKLPTKYSVVRVQIRTLGTYNATTSNEPALVRPREDGGYR